MATRTNFPSRRNARRARAIARMTVPDYGPRPKDGPRRDALHQVGPGAYVLEEDIASVLKRRAAYHAMVAAHTRRNMDRDSRGGPRS